MLIAQLRILLKRAVELVTSLSRPRPDTGSAASALSVGEMRFNTLNIDRRSNSAMISLVSKFARLLLNLTLALLPGSSISSNSADFGLQRERDALGSFSKVRMACSSDSNH